MRLSFYGRCCYNFFLKVIPKAFIFIVVLTASTIILATNIDEENMMKNSKLSITFDKTKNTDGWQLINDGVMGGLSIGYTQFINQEFIFSGKLSTENNGGFSSVYKKIPRLSKDVEAVEIRIKGDGKPYQLRIRSEIMGYDVAYKVDFPTKINAMETHRFNLTDFRASFRGRIINNAPVLKAETISHVGFLIAAKESGDFNLSTQAIEFY